jgi:hypothetical protein
MRYLGGVLFLASCTVLTPSPIKDHSIEPSVSVVDSEVSTAVDPEMGSEASESRQETRKPKLKPLPSPPLVSEISSCANLDAGDLKETIKAKLDCIKENAK